MNTNKTKPIDHSIHIHIIHPIICIFVGDIMAQKKIVMYTSPEMAERVKATASRRNMTVSSLMKIIVYDWIRADEKSLGLGPKMVSVRKEHEEIPPEYFSDPDVGVGHGHD
jgi:hypothetical protein